MNEEKGILIQNISKEFIDILGEVFPQGKLVFLDYIDWFKEDIKWNSFFNEYVKFHDLPGELQVGVLMNLCCSIMGEWPPFPENMKEVIDLTSSLFAYIQANNIPCGKRPEKETKSDINVN